MQEFILIAAAHFLALLSPGPDFFLVARTSMASGWRRATGVCVGITLANGVFIVAAFGGVAILRPGSATFTAIELAGCAYLLYMGWLFLRHAGAGALSGLEAAPPALADWGRGLGRGFLSAILNPKNALFYVSLASVIASKGSGAGRTVFYGLWMASVVLLWDVLVAAAIGNGAVRQRFARWLPLLERLSGLILIVLAAAILLNLAAQAGALAA